MSQIDMSSVEREHVTQVSVDPWDRVTAVVVAVIAAGLVFRVFVGAIQLIGIIFNWMLFLGAVLSVVGGFAVYTTTSRVLARRAGS